MKGSGGGPVYFVEANNGWRSQLSPNRSLDADTNLGKDPNESQESFSGFGEENSQQFHTNNLCQIPPDWESSDAIA